ncbi:MAG: hypothetical protein AAGA27_00820 [Pseudomonadota bacterium]
MNTSDNLVNRVASITIFFWIIKIISTTVGEASADFFYQFSAPGAVIVAFIALISSVIIQMRFKRYVPWMYWTVIIFVAIFGTMFSDTVHFIGVPLEVSTLIFIALLLFTLRLWYKSEGTLDPHYVHTAKREKYYWVVIFFTFCLGTAAGDLVAGRLHFGFLDATLIFGACMIVIPLILYLFRINKIALFWIAYILTRPFGAAGADWIGKPKSHGGLGLGDGTTALLSLAVIVVLVLYLTITHRRQMLIEERVIEEN